MGLISRKLKINLFKRIFQRAREILMESVEYQAVREGRAELLYPKSDKVFYNPIQQFNRDISVLAIRSWAALHGAETSKKRKRQGDGPFIRIFEGLAASGLRSCRYALEIEQVKTVIANDLSPSAVEAIKRNAIHNKVSEKVIAHTGDASSFLHSHKSQPAHVVDLDPYGSASPFLDAAVQAVTDEGILLVTCTDLAILAGNAYPEKCFSQYGGMVARNNAVHESALRLLLNTIASTAARYGRAIEPVLSLSIDYYIRVFVKVRTSPLLVKQNIGKSMVVYCCSGCYSSYNQPLGVSEPKAGWARGPPVGSNCAECDSPYHIAGPMWSRELHSKEFITEMQSQLANMDPETYPTKPRIQGMLALASQELETPFYYNPNSMASIVRSPVPPMVGFVSALLNGGFKASLTHAKAGCIKSDAPASFVWDILRAWAAKNRSKKEMKDSPGGRILQKEQKNTISFEPNPNVQEIELLRKSKITRFPMNPRPEWGPMSRPGNKKRKTKHDPSENVNENENGNSG